MKHSQVKLDLWKQIGDKDMKIETVLEQVLHLKAASKTEEEEQTPKIAVIRGNGTKKLVEAVTKLLNQLSVDDKHLTTVVINRGNEVVLGDGRVMTDETEDNNTIAGSVVGGVFQSQYLSTETDISEAVNRFRRNDKKGFKCRTCEKEGQSSRNCRNFLLIGSSQHLKRNCPFKKKYTKNCNVIRVRPTKSIECLNAEAYFMGTRALD